MKILISLLFILKFIELEGQVLFSYPHIKTQGQIISDFIPSGWTILDSTSGDLNLDKKKDFALVIQYHDTVMLLRNEFDYIDTINAQPRILIILFHDPTSNKYLLAERSNTFILYHENPSMDDPFKSIKIKKGIIEIEFFLFYNMGSWTVTNSVYKFRYQSKAFALIGAENNIFSRATGEYENYSYNFLSKIWSLKKGDEEGKQKVKISQHKLNIGELKTLKTFTQPYSWEVTKDVYL